MPIYEYECPVCKEIKEVTHKVDKDPDPWPTCYHDPKYSQDLTVYGIADLVNVEMRRVISKTGFALKGSGWARDKYGSGNK